MRQCGEANRNGVSAVILAKVGNAGIDKCPQAPIGEITIVCPDSAELQPGWLDALLKQQKQDVVDLRH